jgi:hypothetical protein
MFREDEDTEDLAEEQKVPNLALRHQRELRGWSRLRLAREIQHHLPDAGISEKLIARWERGTRFPRPHYREVLCQIFEKSAAELGFVKDSPFASPGLGYQIILLTDEQAAILYDVLKLGDVTMAHDPTKRETLHKILQALSLAAIPAQTFLNVEPWERLTQATTKPTALNSATLTHFETLIGQCWDLSNHNELDVAERILTSFLPKLVGGTHGGKTAALASQGLRLQSVLAAHQIRLPEKVLLCKQAVEFARGSGDGNSLVSGLTELAVAYKYNKQPEQSLLTYQEALAHVNQATSPLIQARVYAASAAALAKVGRKREALFYSELAQEVFPEARGQDPAGILADFSHYLLIFYTGSVHLDLGEYQRAWDMFGLANSLPIAGPERNRLEIVNQQSRAAIALNNLEGCIACLEDTLTHSLAIGSKKRFNEAVSILQEDLPANWQREAAVKDLMERFQVGKGQAKA